MLLVVAMVAGLLMHSSAQPNIRQNPLEPINHCLPNQYAQITGDGLVCVSTESEAPPVCSPNINCCGGGEFVKLTGQGLQCFPLSDKKATCTYPGEKNCCREYEFGFITEDGLICAAAPIWDVINQFRVPERTSISLDLKEKVLGSPTPTITVGALPAWLTNTDGVLAGKAPRVSRNQTFSVSANAENIAGNDQTSVSVTVQDRSCTSDSACTHFANHRYCHPDQQECDICIEDSHCPNQLICENVENTCVCPQGAENCCVADADCAQEQYCAESNTCNACPASPPVFSVTPIENALVAEWNFIAGYSYQIQYGLTDDCDGDWETASASPVTFSNLPTDTEYHVCLRQKPSKCSTYSTPSIISASLPPTECTNSCETGCTGWTPETAENCSGTQFTQTRSCSNICSGTTCETTRNATGTKRCGEDACISSCTEGCRSGWRPHQIDVCQGTEFTQYFYTECDNICSGVSCNRPSRTRTGIKTGGTCEKVPGVCNNAVQNGCTQGTPNDEAIPDTDSEFLWVCNGINGGIAVSCQKKKPIDGQCDNEIQHGCAEGIANADVYPEDIYYWRCDGLYGGRNSERCSKIGSWKAVNSDWGECGDNTLYQSQNGNWCRCANCCRYTQCRGKKHTESCTGIQYRTAYYECQDGICNEEEKPESRYIQSRVCPC